MRNEMRMEFDAVSNNEGFARVAVAAFIAPLNPTLEEVSDIKTAVSEAVTNPSFMDMKIYMAMAGMEQKSRRVW